MKAYYGLRLIRTFFLALAVIICIAAVASLGTLLVIALFSNTPYDFLQAFFILVTSGFIALLCSAFAQMIDLQLQNYEATSKFIEHLQSNIKERIKLVICLDTITDTATGSHHLHVVPGALAHKDASANQYIKEF